MATYDWSKFILRIPIKGSREQIYRMWATPFGLQGWFLRRAEFRKDDDTAAGGDDHLEKGYTYEWRWHGWGDEIVEKGEVLEANNKDLFCFSFGKGGNVKVEIKQEEDWQMVELTQDGIGTDEESKTLYHIGCMQGWTFYLTNLKSILEGGIDLRNKNEQLKGVLNS